MMNKIWTKAKTDIFLDMVDFHKNYYRQEEEISFISVENSLARGKVITFKINNFKISNNSIK